MSASQKSAEFGARAWQGYAMRAWLTAVLGQAHQARQNLDVQADRLRAELERIEQQKSRADSVIEALESGVAEIDKLLIRHERERESAAKARLANKGSDSGEAPKKRSSRGRPASSKQGGT